MFVSLQNAAEKEVSDCKRKEEEELFERSVERESLQNVLELSVDLFEDSQPGHGSKALEVLLKKVRPSFSDLRSSVPPLTTISIL